jgi:mannose-6-phosphate isomerase-like protein (cupin superfamily)
MNQINFTKNSQPFSQDWNSKTVKKLKLHNVKLAKFQGKNSWHCHQEDDELILVLQGQLIVQFRDRAIVLNEEESGIIPRGVEHQLIAQEEVKILFLEPKTLNRPIA